MYRFLETIRIEDGEPMYLDWHQRRVEATLEHFAAGSSFDLHTLIRAGLSGDAGTLRCRIRYDGRGYEISFSPHHPRRIRSLRLVDVPADYDYRYKYADRTVLEDAFSRRGDADDVLLVRDGWVTDTSVANVAFLKNKRWYTPAIPLLAGTTWKRLVASGVLTPRPIHVEDLPAYAGWTVFNALTDWGVHGEQPMSGILREGK